MYMPLFPNTLLASTFTGTKFYLTCFVNDVSFIILLCEVRANLIDSHFSLSNSHTIFASKEFFIHQHCKLRQGPETQTGFFLILLSPPTATQLLVIPLQCDSVQGKKKICIHFLKCLLILMLL